MNYYHYYYRVIINFDKIIMKIIINNTERRELELKEKSSIKGEIIKLCFQQIETK